MAGTGVGGYSGDAGLATDATLGGPRSVAVAPNGDLYIGDTANEVVRRVSGGIITTVAGLGPNYSGYGGDGGPATQATLSWPYGIAVDANSNLYIVDLSNDRIRVVYGSSAPPLGPLDPSLDSDGDGYPDLREMQMGKSTLVACAIMRADVDADGAVTILDLAAVARYFGQNVPPAPARLNQDGDSAISIMDLARQAAKFGQSSSACP